MPLYNIKHKTIFAAFETVINFISSKE